MIEAKKKRRFSTFALLMFAAYIVLTSFNFSPLTLARADELPSETDAYLAFADASWEKYSYWGGGSEPGAAVQATDAIIDGTNSVYTVSVDIAGGLDIEGIAFMAIIVDDGDLIFPNSTMRLWDISAVWEGTYVDAEDDSETPTPLPFQTLNGSVSLLAKEYTNDEFNTSQETGERTSGGTRINIFNEWGSVSESSRSYDNNLTDVSSVLVDKYAFDPYSDTGFVNSNGEIYDEGRDAEDKIEVEVNYIVKNITATFSFIPENETVDRASLQYMAYDWWPSYWGEHQNPGGISSVNNAYITGAGDYTVGATFEGWAGVYGFEFLALIVESGEKTFGGYQIEITELRINDTPIDLAKGYTTSDDGVATRMNLYNYWVDADNPLANENGEIDKRARSFDGDLDGVTANLFKDNDAFFCEADSTLVYGTPAPADSEEEDQKILITSIEVDFTYHEYVLDEPVEAVLTYQDGNAENVYYNDGYDDPAIEATTAEIDRSGTYSVGLDFSETELGGTDGLLAMSIVIEDAETVFEGWCVKVLSITINGDTEIDFSFGCTYPLNDAIVYDIYNPDIAKPELARSWNSLSATSMTTVDPDDFVAVESVVVVFMFVQGSPTLPMDYDWDAMLAETYNAYLAVQTSPLYIFRNYWYEASYGRDADNNCFTHLTKGDGISASTADDADRNHGGVFTDQELTGSGTYTVALALASTDKGFEGQTGYNFLAVSTDIPAVLHSEGYIEISDIKCVIDGTEFTAATISDGGQYVEINITASKIATTSITITFTVEGLTGEGPDTEPETVDKSALSTLITQCEALTQADYTAESWTAFAEKLAAAKAVVANASATQSEVDAAKTALQTAKDALVKVEDDDGDNCSNCGDSGEASALSLLVLLPAFFVIKKFKS